MSKPASRTIRHESYHTEPRGMHADGARPIEAELHAEVGESTRVILESVRDLGSLLEEESSPCRIIGASAVMQDVLEQARRVARGKLPVLIVGESGTGKELVARLIHLSSPRAHRPFIGVNCAALSETLVESELFGHEKGAFTGADDFRAGRFEMAHGGTLLLDEISEMSVKLQAKLLRVLESEAFERVGGTRTLHVDVNVVATTNRDLEREMAAGAFRADLYYRLDGVQLHLPPLRARREDISALVLHFIEQYRAEAESTVRGVTQQALDLLTAYDWPGNVRQLRNAIRRACILSATPAIQPFDLPSLQPSGRDESRLGSTLADIERRVILDTLRELDGNKTAAAARLGVTPRTLLNKLNKYRREAVGQVPD